jgi:hypothetical protein
LTPPFDAPPPALGGPIFSFRRDAVTARRRARTPRCSRRHARGRSEPTAVGQHASAHLGSWRTSRRGWLAVFKRASVSVGGRHGATLLRGACLSSRTCVPGGRLLIMTEREAGVARGQWRVFGRPRARRCAAHSGAAA